jgi:hypothetical protein
VKLVLQCAMCGTHHPVGTPVCSTCRASGVTQLRLMFECQSCGSLGLNPACERCSAPAAQSVPSAPEEDLILAEEISDESFSFVGFEVVEDEDHELTIDLDDEADEKVVVDVSDDLDEEDDEDVIFLEDDSDLDSDFDDDEPDSDLDDEFEDDDSGDDDFDDEEFDSDLDDNEFDDDDDD